MCRCRFRLLVPRKIRPQIGHLDVSEIIYPVIYKNFAKTRHIKTSDAPENLIALQGVRTLFKALPR